MVLKEFYTSLIILSDFLKSSKIASRLNSFSTSLKGRQGRFVQSELQSSVYPSFETMTDLLLKFEAETGMPLDGSVFLEKVGLSDVLSIAAWQEVRELFRSGDYREGERQIAEKAQTLQNRIGNIDGALRFLGQFDIKDIKDFYKRDKDEVLITLRLASSEADTQIQSLASEITELKKHLELLARIDKRQSAKKFRVLSYSKASPTCIELIAAVGIGTAINKMIGGFLENASKIQDIRKKQEEIRALKLKNSSEEAILKELKQAEDEYKDSAEVVSQIILENIEDSKIDGARAEVEKAIAQVSKYFKKKLDEGAQVRVYFTLTNNADNSVMGPTSKRNLIAERVGYAKGIRNASELRKLEQG